MITLKERWLDGEMEESERLNHLLEQGCVIMHIDGNRENLERGNLALVWRYDASLIVEKVTRSASRVPTPGVITPKKVTKGQQSYTLKQAGKTWEVIGSELSCAPTNACRLAKLHAKSNSLPWPIKQAVGD